MTAFFVRMRRAAGCALAALSLWAALPAPVQAQQAAPAAAPSGAVILTIRMDRLLAESAAGRDIGAQMDALRKKLRSDLDAAQSQLKLEEQNLAAVKSQLSREEFQAKAQAFEEKARGVMEEASKHSEQLIRARDVALAEFRSKIAPVLQRIMEARGGDVMLDETQIVVASSRLDVTAEALKGLDESVKKIQVVFPPADAPKTATAKAP